jgi:hypothetical protein
MLPGPRDHSKRRPVALFGMPAGSGTVLRLGQCKCASQGHFFSPPMCDTHACESARHTCFDVCMSFRAEPPIKHSFTVHVLTRSHAHVHAVVFNADGDPTIGGGLRPNPQSGARAFLPPACGRWGTWRPSRLLPRAETPTHFVVP